MTADWPDKNKCIKFIVKKAPKIMFIQLIHSQSSILWSNLDKKN